MNRPATDLSEFIEAAKQRIANGQFAGARSVLTKALRIDPNSAAALQLMGIVSSELGNHLEGVRYLQRAAALAPSALGVHLNLGKVLLFAGRVDEALTAFGRAAALAPEIPDVHIGYGGALVAAGNLLEAARRFREAIRLKPDALDAHYNIAKVLLQLRDHVGALPEWQYVLQREPGSAEAMFSLASCQQELCDWQDFASRSRTLQAAFETGGATIGTAFFSFWVWDDSAVHKQCAAAEARSYGVAQERPFRKRDLKRPQRIRLAYVSSDFRKHPVARLIAGLLEHHDKSRFETILVALNKDDGSAERRRLEKAADAVFDVHEIKENELVARQLRDRHVHVAIDLMGHTGSARVGIFGHRSAPIQVSYLGFPGTSCVPAIDYMIADSFVASDSVRQTVTEKLVILPDCYQCNDRSRPLPGDVPSRSACGLPEDAFVFGSFHQLPKITPDAFDVWMRVLSEVEDSVLWLVADSEQAKANLRREAETRGVSPSRLVFAGRSSFEDYIARLGLVDLQFDTFPYTSHSTGSDSLWAACPILTLAGTSFPSRVCASLLTTIGVPELIATSWEDYKKIAVNLAQDRGALDKLKARIAQGREASPLFDISRFCRNLERAYEEMVDIAASGRKSQEIDVRRLV